MISVSDLPTLNACLNGTSALLLTSGFAMIRRKKIRGHKICMITAAVASALFLTSYVTYHSLHGFTRFPGVGLIRTIYFVVLIPHTILAISLVALVPITLFQALRERFDKHRRIARWTLPIWLYVSVTGVVIYLMLYHLT